MGAAPYALEIVAARCATEELLTAIDGDSASGGLRTQTRLDEGRSLGAVNSPSHDPCRRPGHADRQGASTDSGHVRRRASASFHPPVEEYLATLYEMDEENVPTIQARLSERLSVSAPSVSEMVRRLEADGYLDIVDRVLQLTPAGRTRAEAVVRKHRLAERLLTDVIGLPWEKAHIEAGRWEHVISDEVEERLVELLHHPATCPHGNPIPGANPSRLNLKPLTAARPGEHVRLERVSESLEMDAQVRDPPGRARVHTGRNGHRQGPRPRRDAHARPRRQDPCRRDKTRRTTLRLDAAATSS